MQKVKSFFIKIYCWICKLLIVAGMRIVFRPKIRYTNKAALKEYRRKPAIFIVNHTTLYDGIVMFSVLNKYKANILIAKDWYEKEAFKTILEGNRCIPLDRKNPEYMAKAEMRKRGVEEELIAAATGTADTDNEQIIEARKIFADLYEKYREKIQPEAEKVKEAGGLFILGTERHESRRIDNQLRGRAGRQGDPGASAFYLSLDDDLLRLFGGERITGIIDKMGLPEDQPLDARLLSNTIENAQKH